MPAATGRMISALDLFRLGKERLCQRPAPLHQRRVEAVVTYHGETEMFKGLPQIVGESGRRAMLHRQHRHLIQNHLRHLSSFRSEEHTSELQSLMRISYAFFCL